jgi:hypothetical protein
MQTPRKVFQREVRPRNIQATLIQPGLPNRYCVVSDISDGGAKIIVDGKDPIPARFELALGGDERRVCESIWWHGRTAGLRFVR